MVIVMKTTLMALSFVVLSARVCVAEDVRTVDLQWSVCDTSAEVVLKKIASQNPANSEKFGGLKKITYFDTEAGAYIRDGVSFRTKVSKRKSESSVKVRFANAHDIPGADCSWDRYGNDQKWTCEVVNDSVSDSQVWSKKQLEFLSDEYQPVSPDSLGAYGPYKNPKWKFKIDQWDVAFDSVETREVGPLMEFSVKVPVTDGDAVYLRFSEWLHAKGVTLCERQEPKTLRLLRALGRI